MPKGRHFIYYTYREWGCQQKIFGGRGFSERGREIFFIHILIYKCGLLEGFLLYLVCYDVGFILYGAQAVIWLFARGAVRRADVGIGPYESACRGGRPCPPGPDNATPCRAGPVCPAVGAGKIRFGPSRTPAPTKRFVGAGFCPSRGRPQGSPLRKRYKRRGGVRNPPFLRPFKIIFSSLLLSMQRMCFSGQR